jgi:hypothetical protein
VTDGAHRQSRIVDGHRISKLLLMLLLVITTVLQKMIQIPTLGTVLLVHVHDSFTIDGLRRTDDDVVVVHINAVAETII